MRGSFMSSVTMQKSINTALPANGDSQDRQALPNPQDIVFQAGLGYIVSACLGVAAKLRLADLIGSGVEDVSSLAERTNTNADYLFRVLRVLEMTQIISMDGARRFRLTPAGELLRSDTPGSLAAAVEWLTDPLHFSVYGELLHSVKTGATAFDSIHGEQFFKWVCREENADE